MATPVHTFLTDLWADLQNPAIIWQVGALAVCLLLAWWLARFVRARVAAHPRGAAEDTSSQSSALAARSLDLGRGSLERLSFPLIALLLVMVGRAVLSRNFQHDNLLFLAERLLFAMAAIRVVVYLLRNVFTASGALKAGERWLAFVVWLGAAADITGLMPDIIEFLESVSFHVGKQAFSLWLIGQGVFSVALTLLVSLWLSSLFESRLMRADSLDMSFRVVAGRFTKALLVVIAVMVSMALVGIDLTVLSVFGGALGVGLGLGLQRVASNYVCGFIILLDHSIRIGDMITVDKFHGTVTQINTRYTVLKGLDGTESIIPNETLVSTPVINHSYTNRSVALSIPLAVAYDTDLDAVREILLRVAAAHERVLPDPPPRVALARFGADGLELELSFWIEDPEMGSNNVRSDLNFEIWREFKAKGIEIPYPQRQVRVIGPPPAPAGQAGGQSSSSSAPPPAA